MSAIVPIFLVVGVGYIAVQFGPFKREDMSILSTFVVKIALPILVFVNVYGKAASEIFRPTYLLTYALTAIIMFGLAYLYAKVMKRSKVRATFMGIGMAGTNNGFMGLPIFLILVPEWAGVAVGMDMLVDNVSIIPLTLFLAEHATGSGSLVQRLKTTVREVLLHPLVIAIALALILNSIGFVMPDWAGRSVDLLANTTTGLALFTVGGILAGLQIKGALLDVFVAVGGKLVAMPAIAIGVLTLLIAIGLPDLPIELKAAAIITCALPTYSILPSLAEPYGEADVSTAIVMLSILVSFITLAAWIVILGSMGWL